MGYYSTIKEKEILPFATTRMKLEGIMQSEVSQTEKHTNVQNHLYVESENKPF